MKRMDNQNIYAKIKPTPSRLFLAFVLVHAKPILRSPKWNFIFNLVSCKAHGIFIIITDGSISRTVGMCFVLSLENCSHFYVGSTPLTLVPEPETIMILLSHVFEELFHSFL